ncbi:ATP-binding protein [Streptomyces tubercidicus]|uniref:histidine kinase n=1 Tax=Streptomyces tubercidicus TaxID=47759 RepID=A0A640UJ80_9ACTN|nr:HAMP domain-containing sensor histidine kinase [Streptomyces tubercidicus]WAU10488.1 HAMP domain-containing histidine kinase [Streptomyces tubercidicus]GFE35590.1 two-component sensor histidine kinase [Streptomyces tubercidicus]
MSAGRPRTRLRLPAWTARLYWKFAVFVIVMCCVLAVLVGVLVHVLVDRQTEDQARGAALSELDTVAAAYTAGEPLGRNAAVDPADLPSALRTMARHGERGTQLADHRGRPAMWAVTPADGKALAVHLDYSQRAAALRGLDRAIIGSSAFAIALTLLVGLFAVSRITRRLHHTAQVARRISTGDLDARVDDPRVLRPEQAQDEAAAVAAALDAMAAALQTKLHSEQRFTADVAHELRTPLTGLRLAAELLPPGRPTEMVQERIRTMSRLTEDLLEISRLDAEVEQAEIDEHQLGPLVEGAVLATGQEAEVRIARDTRVATDQRRLQRVLGNLVTNAHRHGRPPVILTVSGLIVTVRDHGDGYPGQFLDHGPQRFSSHSKTGKKTGHGLGLTIATGQARVLGATLRFSNAPDGGAIAELVLPAWTLERQPQQ